jgi:aldehyde:ferredoxin oxidoreductase
MGRNWYGWKGVILRVDLSERKIVKQELSMELAKNYIGCRGINSKILYDEVKPGTDAFSPENELIFGTGPLDGTPVGMGRVSVTTKSTRGTLIEGGFGGFFGPELKFAGYDHLIIKGRAEKPVYIWIDDESVEIRDAAHLWGKTTWVTDKIIKDEIGDPSIQVACIGPAAENLVSSCPVVSNLTHTGGRGCGTIMGAKKLKAIAVRGSGEVKVAYPAEFEKAYAKIREALDLRGSKDRFTVPWAIFGPSILPRIFNEEGGLMSLNAQRMAWEHADDISGEKYLMEYVMRPNACFCCPFPSCSTWFQVKDGPYAGTVGGKLTAGDVICLGSLIGVNYLPAILKTRSLCDQLGLDVFHVGFALSWAMECFEKGILTEKDTDGIALQFGNHEGVIEMVKKIAYRDGFGGILAEGVEKASRIVGKGSERYALAVKGQELEGMPQRNLYVAALGVATSEVGPDHTRWYPPYPPHPQVVAREVLEELHIDVDFEKALNTRSPEGKGRLLKWLTDTRAVFESIPTCVFILRGELGIDLRIWREVLVKGTGVDFSCEELMKAGERIINIERAFIVREGFRREHDTIPRRMLEEPVPERYYGPISRGDLDRMLDEYYEARGWDKGTAIPTRRKLEELGLKEVADELEKLKV